MKTRYLILLVMLAVVGLDACRRLPPTPPAPELAADQVLSRLKAGRGELAAFAARGRLTLISPQQNATGTALIKGRLPETLRVDLKDPLGRAVLSFATDGRLVEILFPRENKLLRGPATPGNLASFVPPQVKLAHALRILVGDLPLSSGLPQRTRFEAAEKMYVLEWLKRDNSVQERLWVAAEDFQLRKQEWFGPDGQTAFRVELGEFQPSLPGRPRQLKLMTFSPHMELRLSYRDFTPNPSLSAADLTVPRPPGVAVQPLKP
jgi:hypothetical protein